jgi:hypothetical protein
VCEREAEFVRNREFVRERVFKRKGGRGKESFCARGRERERES